METKTKCKQCEEWRTCQPCNPVLNTGSWPASLDGMLEARLLTMLEEGASVQNITQDLRICEAWLGQLMLLMYLEGLFTVTCSL